MYAPFTESHDTEWRLQECGGDHEACAPPNTNRARHACPDRVYPALRIWRWSCSTALQMVHITTMKGESKAYQQSCHPKQQHVYEVCCAKLEGDLLQLGAILNAA